MSEILTYFRNKDMSKAILYVAIAISLLFHGCAKEESETATTSGDNNDVQNAVEVLVGSVSSSSAATSSSSRSSRSAAASMESCTIEAYDMNDTKVATTQATGDNQTYSFDENQLKLGVDYKIVSVCSYGGQAGVRMSSYARTISEKTQTPEPIEVNPKTTAIAVMVKEAIVNAIDSTASVLGLNLDSVKKAVLASVGKIIDDMVAELEADSSFIFPDDPLEADKAEEKLQEVSIADIDNSSLSDMKSKLDNVTSGDDWDVTTAKGKMDAAAAQGKKDMACVKTPVHDVGEENYQPKSTHVLSY